MVYVPSYNPWTAYGESGDALSRIFAAECAGIFFRLRRLALLRLRFGLGIAMGAFTHMKLGLAGMGIELAGADDLLLHQSNYFTQSTSVLDWGLPYGGPRAYGWHGAGNGYYRNGDTPRWCAWI